MSKINGQNIVNIFFNQQNIIAGYYQNNKVFTLASEPVDPEEREYTFHEYLQGNGTSYMIIDYYPQANSWFEIDVEGRQASSTTSKAGECGLFGCFTKQNSSVSTRRHAWEVLYPGTGVKGNGGIRYDWGSQANGHNNSSQLILSRGVIKLTPPGYGYINDTQIVTISSATWSSEESVCNCALFAYRCHYTDDGSFSVSDKKYGGKVYSLKIYEDDVLVHDYIPATQVATSITGMYDKITGAFSTSEVETPFEIGPEIEVEPDEPDVPVPEYGFGADGTEIGQVVYYNASPIGVIAVDDSITGDGSIRIMSLDNMSGNTPQTGTNTLELLRCPTKNLYTNSEFYNRFSGPTTVYTSSSTFVDGLNDYRVMIDYVDSVSSNDGWREYTSIAESTSQTRTYIPAAMACRLYSAGDLLGYWYLPSFHELTIVSQNKDAVNTGFANAGTGNGKILDGASKNQYTHWSSRFNYIQSSWGGNCHKYYISGAIDTTKYYGTSADPGVASAFLKLKWVDKDKLTLEIDTTYYTE